MAIEKLWVLLSKDTIDITALVRDTEQLEQLIRILQAHKQFLPPHRRNDEQLTTEPGTRA
jgi:hypothetical protein